MKILGIRIKNLASLEGLTEIDFTRPPLSSAGIFAITGPTGAGKSTILDALCLALYSKTPRYLQAREAGIEVTDVHGSAISQGDVRGILRDGTGEGFAAVDFAGVDGQRYRATWRVHRARERADGSLQAFSVALKNLDTNADIPGRKTELQDEIERLVGLNFEQFTRSVLLAQGDFTAFLKAAKDEKSALLEKLTGTSVYSEISKQIFVNYRKEEQELGNLHIQRAGIPTLTTEDLEDLELQKASLEQSTAAQEQEVAQLNREIAWHTQQELLQSNLTAARTVQEQAHEARQQAAGREQQLWLVEQVQPTRTWVDSRQTAGDQLAGKMQDLQQLQATFHDQQQRKEALDIQWQKAHEDVAAKIQQQEAAIPLLEEARALDIQIREKTAQVVQATDEVNNADAHYQQQQQQVLSQQQQVNQLFLEIKKLQQWQADNKTRQPVAENHNLIRSKLQDAGTLLDAGQLLSHRLAGIQSNIDQAKQAGADLQARLAAITQSLQTGQANLTTAAEVVGAISITVLEKDKAAIDLDVEDIIKAEAHWKLLSANQADLDAVKQKLDRNRTELDRKTQLLAQAADQLALVATARDASLRMLNKARIATAESVTSLRAQLTPGDPCPVCGSMEHPYAMHHPALDHVLQQLEATHAQQEADYTTSLAGKSSLQEGCSQLAETINTEEQQVGTRAATLAGYQEAWQRFAIYHRVAGIPDPQKASWLAQQLQETRTKQKELQQQIQTYAVKKQELEALRRKVNDLDRHLNEATNALKDTERNLLSLQEQWTQCNKELLDSNSRLAEIEQDLSAYFTTPGWFGQWKNDPASFVQRINGFVDKWRASIQQLEEHSRRHTALSATLTATQQQLEDYAADVQKKQVVLAGIKQQQDILTQQRKEIFAGEPATTVESGLRQAVAAAQQALEQYKTGREQLKTAITRTGTQKEQLEKDISMLQQQVTSFSQKIQDWLTAFNERSNLAVDTGKLAQLLTPDAAWIEAERAALRTIDDTITQARSVLQERTTQLQRHEQQRLSERGTAVLNELLSTAKAGLQQQVQQKNEIGFRLQLDLGNRQQVGELLGRMEDQALVVENWAKLNEIIGSADGKKFRQIAQEYTLDALLSYANVHLEMLSRRYLLQRIPNTLGLQVLDQDMGDEVRTVYSLSGGESFLVSLALALGLASLSSSRMQVESLFIDEGFGSLDPATLNIAMDALERLHNQGRKVGVISHVQEMTERIPVQIKVSKQRSGKSKVEVAGF